jgi:hypothetical protein
MKLAGGFFCLFVIFFVMDCGPPDAGKKKENQETGTKTMLPREFYGQWKFAGSSGGFAGDGDTGYAIEKIIITQANVIESYKEGKLVSSVSFTVGKGKSIYSGKEAWLITMGAGGISQVVEIYEDGSLGIADNVYDGFSYGYKRVEDTGGTERAE